MIDIKDYLEEKRSIIRTINPPKAQKLEILNYAKEVLMLAKSGDIYIGHIGLCGLISELLIEFSMVPIPCVVKMYFPEFKNQNAIVYCNARPSKDHEYWWDVEDIQRGIKYDFDNRINFIDFLISKL